MVESIPDGELMIPLSAHVEIWIFIVSIPSANVNGIPAKAVDKIFQPFFTTKPTGQGIGLGLSLSYDIVKAHRGEVTVETKDAEGTEFIILLPVVWTPALAGQVYDNVIKGF